MRVTGRGNHVQCQHRIARLLHETMVIAYALAATGGNVMVAVLFGMLSNAIYLLFARYCNTDCGTHIDPPAVAIGICSLILFNLV